MGQLNAAISPTHSLKSFVSVEKRFIWVNLAIRWQDLSNALQKLIDHSVTF